MLKSLKSNSYRFVVVLLLLLTFLTIGVGKVIPSYAMALPSVEPELAPVFDTQIYQFQEYCQENLSDAQYNILYFILGAWIATQAGMTNYTINNPFDTEDGVINWFKSIGLRATNTLLNFGIGYDPVTGTDLRKEIGFYVWYAMGAAELASKYADFNEFINDVDNSEHFYLPFDQSLQIGLNTVLGLQGGIYEWQNDRAEFVTDATWQIGYMSDTAFETYYNYLNSLPYEEPYPRYNYANGAYLTCRISYQYFYKYHNLFVNSTTNKFYLCDDNGNYDNRTNLSPYIVTGKNNYAQLFSTNIYNYQLNTYDPALYTDVVTLVRDFYNNVFRNSYGDIIFYNDIITNVYYGPSWQDKIEVHNDTNLNFSDSLSIYYNQVQTDYLIDIKDLLSDLVNVTDLYHIILNNLLDNNGNVVIDPSLIQVNVNLPDDNPLPVNLNDIQLYTDNEYLDVVKERSLQASETIGEYVAFWHNCDPELVYAILGSFIVILIGAFIGKWGHS